MSDTLARHGKDTDRSRQPAENHAGRPGRGRTRPIGWERDTGRRNAPGWLSLDE